MPAHISMITLGVSGLAASTRFYEALGFVKSKKASQDSVTFLKAGGVVLGLFGRESLIEDAHAQGHWTGQGGIALAQNLESEAAVDDFMAHAESCGAKIMKPAQKVFWGGYSGYFADPDGHLWEVAHNPFIPLGVNGAMALPD